MIFDIAAEADKIYDEMHSFAKAKVCKDCGCLCKDCKKKGCDCKNCKSDIKEKKSALHEVMDALRKVADLQDEFGLEASSAVTTVAMEVMQMELSKIAWDDENEVMDWRDISPEAATDARSGFKLDPEVMRHLRRRFLESKDPTFQKMPNTLFDTKDKEISAELPSENELASRTFPKESQTDDLWDLLNPYTDKDVEEDPSFSQDEATVRPGKPTERGMKGDDTMLMPYSNDDLGLEDEDEENTAIMPYSNDELAAAKRSAAIVEFFKLAQMSEDEGLNGFTAEDLSKAKVWMMKKVQSDASEYQDSSGEWDTTKLAEDCAAENQMWVPGTDHDIPDELFEVSRIVTEALSPGGDDAFSAPDDEFNNDFEDE